MQMHLTWLDNNSWLIEMGGQRILLDPWLVGTLVFGNMPWFFEGRHLQPPPFPDQIDLILLSQGLEDHAHTPTLQQLDRSIPVVASPNATKVVQKLGYSNVTTLAHGEISTLSDRLQIQATPGSPIGPFLVENGYVLTELSTGTKLYYEPHGFHTASLQELAPVEVVITPLVNLGLPLVGPIVQGKKTALQVVEWLKPKVIIPTAAGGTVEYHGLLPTVLQTEGSIEEMQSTLAAQQIPTQVLMPQPGERFVCQV
jgi:L-ascorbate metabolism protein UlaG (beta-lactamase superfamily)